MGETDVTTLKNRSCKRASRNTSPVVRRGLHHCEANAQRKMAKQGDMPTEGHIEEIESMGKEKITNCVLEL